jgi:hypothetical protein
MVAVKIGRARIKPHFAGDPNRAELCQLTVDPRIAPGVSARAGSIGVIESTGQEFFKFGPANTDWKLTSVIVTKSTFNFLIADWISIDAGENYGITVTHGLNDLNPTVEVYNSSGKMVLLQDFIIIDANNVQMKVSQAVVDSRFDGTLIILTT